MSVRSAFATHFFQLRSGLVAGNLDEDLGMLALELMGLCAVHSMILLLVTVEVNGDGEIENRVIKSPIV